MRTIKIVGRNHIFLPLCLIKAVHNKRKRNQSRMCYGNLNNSLKIHEENTKKITAVSVVLYVIKFHVNLHKL